jgi:hypothetical protein
VYGLRPDLDLSFWSGVTLNQVCIGQIDFRLNFSLPSVSLSAQTSYRVTTRTNSSTYESAQTGASHLVELLGMTVTRAFDRGQGTLRIEFGESASIEVFDEDPNYECYQVEHDGQLIVV